MKIEEVEALINQRHSLTEYIKLISQNIEADWNVERSLRLFGHGKSNECTNESKAIKRYYVEPFDKRFSKIFLNFGATRNIESIVWFIKQDNSEFLSLRALTILFGQFKIRKIIYDDTTELLFTSISNCKIETIKTSFVESVESRSNGSLFYVKDNKEVDIEDNYNLNNLTLVIKDVSSD